MYIILISMKQKEKWNMLSVSWIINT